MAEYSEVDECDTVVTGLRREREMLAYLVKKRKTFVKDEDKISGRVRGVK